LSFPRAARRSGFAEREVRVELPSRRKTVEFAERLEAEGVPVVRRWTFPGAAVWKVADPYPFAVFGGSGRLGGHGSADSPQGVTVFVYSSVGLGFGNVPVLGLASVNRVRNGLPCASSPW